MRLEPRVKITMMLADHAQAVGGKLYIAGGGWSRCGPVMAPFAIVLDVKVPWELANVRHKVRLELIDSEGRPVVLPGPDGENPLVLDSELEVGRPPGSIAGTPLDAPLAINFAPLPLEVGQRYEWRLMVNGDCEEDWSLPFSVRTQEQAEAEAAA